MNLLEVLVVLRDDILRDGMIDSGFKPNQCLRMEENGSSAMLAINKAAHSGF